LSERGLGRMGYGCFLWLHTLGLQFGLLLHEGRTNAYIRETLVWKDYSTSRDLRLHVSCSPAMKTTISDVLNSNDSRLSITSRSHDIQSWTSV
jgi:hypothetical protein